MVDIKHFYLNRKEDVNGVSGTGIVARGIVLPSGHAVLEWLTFTSSISIFNSLDCLIEVHSHGGKTEIIMGDPPKPKLKKTKNDKTTSK